MRIAARRLLFKQPRYRGPLPILLADYLQTEENTMPTHEFVCPDCATRLEFDELQRSVAVQSGCPLCGRPIGQTEFEPTTG